MGFPGSLAGKRVCLQCRRPRFYSWVGKIPWRRDRLPISVFLGFPGGSDGKESACNAGDLGLIPGLGRSPGGGHGKPLQYSCLENPHGQRSLVGYSPWDFPSNGTGVDCHFLLQWIFPTQDRTWVPHIVDRRFTV